MNVVFYVSGAVALIATVLAITRLNAVHSLLYLILSLLAIALVFLSLGAPFVAALEVIIYAGAIMVLFIFVVMMLNLGPEAARQERQWQNPGMWAGPAILAAILLAELIYTLVRGAPLGAGAAAPGGGGVAPHEVSVALYGPYLLGVELASLLLTAGLVGAYHLGRTAVPGRPLEGRKE